VSSSGHVNNGDSLHGPVDIDGDKDEVEATSLTFCIACEITLEDRVGEREQIAEAMKFEHSAIYFNRDRTTLQSGRAA